MDVFEAIVKALESLDLDAAFGGAGESDTGLMMAVYSSDVINCVKDVCNYIYKTHGRFPAHCEAIHVPGIWLQVHHVEIPYYDRFFRNGLSEAHRRHNNLWHAELE